LRRIQEEESFRRIHDVLEATSHNSFPVVRKSPMGSVVIGTMLRRQLEKLLVRAERVHPQHSSDLAAYQSLVNNRSDAAVVVSVLLVSIISSPINTCKHFHY
jgi:hypothetical protein